MRIGVSLLAMLMTAAVAAGPAAAQQAKGTPAAKAAAARQAQLAEFETQFKDKGFARDVLELLLAINVDRAAYDRVQRKNNHSDQKMIQAARDTRDLGLSGRQNLDDISNSTKSEIEALRRHALGPRAGQAKGSKR